MPHILIRTVDTSLYSEEVMIYNLIMIAIRTILAIAISAVPMKPQQERLITRNKLEATWLDLTTSKLKR